MSDSQKIDSKRRVTLPKEFAGCSHVIIERISDTEVRILRANIVPDVSHKSRGLLEQGLKDAEEGKLSELTDDLLAAE